MMPIVDRAWFGLLSGLVSLFSSAQAQPKIYWTETRPEGAFVVRANLDGSGVTDIISGADKIKGPNGLEFGNGALFWTDQQLNIVSKANPDGSAAAPFISANNPYDVFIGKERVFWTSQSENYIDSAKLDGSDPIRIHSRTTVTSPFAVEVTDTAIYWSEVRGSGRIQRSDLNGGNIVTVIDRVYTYDMQISGDFIYLGDNNYPAAMKRAKLDGSDLKKLFEVDFVNGVWVTKDAIYWSDLSSIHRAGLDGSNPVALHYAAAGSQVRGVVVVEESGPTASEPVLGGARRVGNNFIFSVQAFPGKTVQIEKTSTPAGGAWSVVSSFNAGAEAVNITNAVNPSAKIETFRARSN